MRTLAIDLTPRSEPGPACAKCNAPTRLIGIEPHPTKAHTDLRTYQCLACDHMQAEIVALGGARLG
jgi:hypothetical protein